MEQSVDTTKNTSANGAESLQEIIRILAQLDEETQIRLINAATIFLNIAGRVGNSKQQTSLAAAPSAQTKPSALGTFSGHDDISPKEFLHQKEAKTDVEKTACLAYYLTHYRATPHFKTIDISKLNTEAAQLKFSNAAVAVENSTKKGFLVPSIKGQKQLSAVGEMYVQALPDREAANQVMQKHGPRRTANNKVKRASVVEESQ
jgi:hypothetical protein